MNIEEAREADLKEILDLQYLAYQSEAKLFNNPDIPPLKQTLNDLLEEYHNGKILKACRNNGVIMGSVRGYCKSETVYIGKLIVHPEVQGQGLGTKLLSAIENKFPDKRFELFTSTKSLRNISLYKRLGYSCFSEEQITDEIKFVYMEKVR